MTAAERREKVQHLQSEANGPKSALIHLVREMEQIGAMRHARKLEAIIGKLEAWQHTQALTA